MRRETRTSPLLAALAGGVLFSFGLVEARRLATGDDADARRAANTTGPTRAVAGALLLARPRVLATVLANDPSAAAASPWLARMVGTREVVLGLATVTASWKRQDVRPWLLVLSLIDAGEALILVDAVWRRTVRRAPGAAFVAADAGSAAAGLGLIAQMRRPGHEMR